MQRLTGGGAGVCGDTPIQQLLLRAVALAWHVCAQLACTSVQKGMVCIYIASLTMPFCDMDIGCASTMGYSPARATSAGLVVLVLAAACLHRKAAAVAGARTQRPLPAAASPAPPQQPADPPPGLLLQM